MYGRREFLKLGAGAGVLSQTRTAWAQSAQEIVLGIVTSNTGLMAYAGEGITRGATLAVELQGSSILGRQIKLLVREDEARPAVGVRRVQEAVVENGMRFFTGNALSAVGLAESEVAQREKVLQYAGGGSEDFTGARCGRYTLQWSAHPYTAVRTTLEYVRNTFPDCKRIYTLTADFVFGYALKRYTEVVAKELEFEIVGNDNVPSGEKQFDQYLGKVISSNPDFLCLNLAGTDAVNAVRQFTNYGNQKIKVGGPWALDVDQMPELTAEMRDGLILGQNYYPTIDTPVNRDFVAQYTRKYGIQPGYVGAYAFDSIRTIFLGMQRANSATPADVIRALEGWTWDGLLGPTSLDAKTHQTVRPYFVVRGKSKSEAKSATDFAEIVATGSRPQPEAMNVCKMPSF